MTDNDDRPRFRITALVALLSITASAFVSLAWISFNSYQKFKSVTQQNIQIESARGKIIYLDEVLTMSARMAAATGDDAWEDRYRRYEPQLDNVIKDAERSIASSGLTDVGTSQTDEANKRLVEMENEAFSLIRKGKAEEAKAILFSENYEKEKRTYAEGMRRFESLLTDTTQRALAAAKTRASLAVTISFLAGILLFVFWTFAAHRSRFQSAVARTRSAERALVRERDYSALLIRNAPVLICGITEKGVATLVNPAFEGVTGYPAGELIGRNLFDLLFPGKEYEQIGIFLENLKKGDLRDYEMTLTTRDGQRKTISWNSLKQSNEDGKLIGIIGFGHDVTEKNRVEQKLRESEDRHRLILKTANDAFVGMCSNGLVIDWNNQAETIFGWRREEILGRNLSDTIIPPQYREAHRNGLKKFLRTGEGPVLNNRVELTALHRDGREFSVEITIWPVHAGEDLQFNAFIRDLTEKKKLEAQILQSQKMEMVGTLAGGIAHDLNNQLTPVRGYIDLLLQQTDPGHPNHQILTEANQSAVRCAEVIQRLTQFSRPTTRQKTPFLISESFIGFKSMMSSFLPSTIHVEFNCANDIWPIEADETELHTVLMNLSVNARDAMPQGGSLTVEAQNIDFGENSAKETGSKSGPHVLISVTDTGTGMPPEIVKRIFEPFFTTKEKGKGTGLGLAMVFKIVREHEGWIDVSSKVGRGTSLHIFLPAKPGAVVSPVRAKTGIPEHLLSKNETVLLADDEEAVRSVGGTLLKRLGYKVLMAHDGEEAVKLYMENPETIDLLMLDMTMPKMTGVQTIQQILKVNPKAKIIAVSGYSAEGTPQELIRHGAADFIQKPYTIMLLAQALRKTLDSNNF